MKAFPHDVIHVLEGSRHGIHKAQVLSVHKPLKSVSRVCDVGHRVMNDSKAGCVRSPSMKEKIILKRENKVYRLKVLLSKSFSGEVWTCQAIHGVEHQEEVLEDAGVLGDGQDRGETSDLKIRRPWKLRLRHRSQIPEGLH